MSNDYLKYRGKCKEFSEKLISENPDLVLVRGYYYCPIWNREEQHWWCKDKENTIIDPTKDQFPSKGCGEYIEFNGIIQCSECGREKPEEEMDIQGGYAFCSYKCYGIFVGVF